MKYINVGIAEDQEIFRKGLIGLVESIPGVTITAEATNGLELLTFMHNRCPDVVILDYNMPVLNGIQTALEIKKKFHHVRVIILSMYSEEEIVLHALENGVHAFLSKDDDLEEIERAIKGVLSNNYFFNDRLSKVFLNQLLEQGKIDPIFPTNAEKFSVDELKIIQLISEERTTSEIAQIMNKSVRTIEKYRTTMMDRVGAQNSIGLIMYAIKHKLLSI
jgi:DNA-binding NarL/FixJ family response regulator